MCEYYQNEEPAAVLRLLRSLGRFKAVWLEAQPHLDGLGARDAHALREVWDDVALFPEEVLSTPYT